MHPKELEKIELKDDGREAERFEAFTRKIVNVSKKDIDTKEKEYKEGKLQKKAQAKMK